MVHVHRYGAIVIHSARIFSLRFDVHSRYGHLIDHLSFTLLRLHANDYPSGRVSKTISKIVSVHTLPFWHAVASTRRSMLIAPLTECTPQDSDVHPITATDHA